MFGEFVAVPVWGTVLILILMVVACSLVRPLYLAALLPSTVAPFIYLALSSYMFALPMGESLPISDLFGGSLDENFNKLSFGVVVFVVGMMPIIVRLLIQTMIKKTTEGEES